MILRTRHFKPRICTPQNTSLMKNFANGTLPTAQKVSKESMLSTFFLMGHVAASNYPSGCFWLVLVALINIIGGSKKKHYPEGFQSGLLEKSRFGRYDPSVHEVMRHLMSEITRRSNWGQLVVPTSLRKSELQYDLFIPKYGILHPSSVFNSMADHLKTLGFVAGIATQMFVRDKKVQLPRKLSYKLGRSLFKKVGTRKDQKIVDDFVQAGYLNEYSSRSDMLLHFLLKKEQFQPECYDSSGCESPLRLGLMCPPSFPSMETVKEANHGYEQQQMPSLA